MSTELKLRRGTTVGHSSFTGAAGEVTIDSDKDVAVVHDGVTQGGFPLAREFQIDNVVSLSSVSKSRLKDGHTYWFKEWWPNTGVGGGLYIWKAGENTSNHNGGTIKDPLRSSALNDSNKTFNGYHTPVSGNLGCFVIAQLTEMWLDIFGILTELAPTDNSEAFDALSEASTGVTIRGIPGTYQVSTDVVIPANTPVDCPGVILSSVVAGPSGFTSAVFSVDGATGNSLPSLSADIDPDTFVATGQFTISFVAAHNLSVGDDFVVRNPNNGSYSPFRSYYREGEIFTVARVVDSDSVVVDKIPYGYHSASASTIHKCEFSHSGILRIETEYTGSDGDAIAGTLISRVARTDLSGLKSKSTGFSALLFANCYKTYGSALVGEQTGDGATSLQYGLAVYSCQDSEYIGEFVGGRHGCTYTGGSAAAWDLPSRGCAVRGFFKCWVGNRYAADFHGNAEYCEYTGYCSGGVNMAGDHNRVNLVLHGPDQIVATRELKGTDHDYTIHATVNSDGPSAILLLDDGTYPTERGGTIRVRGVLKLRGSIVNAVDVQRKTTPSSVDWVIDLSELDIQGAPTTNHLRSLDQVSPAIITPTFKGTGTLTVLSGSSNGTSDPILLPWSISLPGAVRTSHVVTPFTANVLNNRMVTELRTIGNATFEVRMDSATNTPFGEDKTIKFGYISNLDMRYM